MWSIYDTLILVAGILTVGIAFLPNEAIPAKTRMTAGAIGVAVVILAFVLGGLRSFTYPSLVLAGPIIPVLAAGAIWKQAKEKQRSDAAINQGMIDVPLQSGHDYTASPVGITAQEIPLIEQPAPEPENHAVVAADPAQAGPLEPVNEDQYDARGQAWAEVFDPQTSATRLAEIAAAHPEFAREIAVHPNAYPELRAWAQQING